VRARVEARPAALRALDRCAAINLPVVIELRGIVLEGISQDSAENGVRPRYFSHVLVAALLLVAAIGGTTVGRHYPQTAAALPPQKQPSPTSSIGGGSTLASGKVSMLDGRLFYRFGQEALQRHDTALAIPLLSRAADAPADAYYVDDALFQLMLLLDSRGDLARRNAVATRIASLSPSSPFLNTTTRRFLREIP